MSATGNIFMCNVGLAVGGFKIQYNLENLPKKGKKSQWILGITWHILIWKMLVAMDLCINFQVIGLSHIEVY